MKKMGQQKRFGTVVAGFPVGQAFLMYSGGYVMIREYIGYSKSILRVY